MQNTRDTPVTLTKLFEAFFNSEKTGGLLLLLCTAISLCAANLADASYIEWWHREWLGHPAEFWINDVLMSVFFLLVGLEIERELYIGELSDIRKSMLPVVSAIGGMLVPAAIHLAFNFGKTSQSGFGIPMATDIAFSLGVLSLLGSRVPVALKVFLTALAIIDDLGAILVIAIFYSHGIAWAYLGGAALLFGGMLVMNRSRFHVTWVYLALGCVLWFLIWKAGIHPAITGVLVAFALPFGNGDERSPSYRLQAMLHKPVAFGILPLFALCNTAFAISAGPALAGANSLGIVAGLFLGKPIGIWLSARAAVAARICSLPHGVSWNQVLFTGLIAGIGFTMSIFIALLAFSDHELINQSKLAILIASGLSGAAGYAALRISAGRAVPKKAITQH